jgi:hypothetical protein
MKSALFLAPLAAVMLLAGCADWHWYRMDGQEPDIKPITTRAAKSKPEAAPVSAPAPASAPTPAPTSTAAAPAAAPMPAPAPTPRPKPAPVSASSQSLDQRVVGHWRRPGDVSCAAGPEIANDHGRLLITTDGRKSIHKLEGVNSRRILTRVVEPAGGPRYRLRIVKGGGDAERPFTLDVQNRVTGGTVAWTPCSVS